MPPKHSAIQKPTLPSSADFGKLLSSRSSKPKLFPLIRSLPWGHKVLCYLSTNISGVRRQPRCCYVPSYLSLSIENESWLPRDNHLQTGGKEHRAQRKHWDWRWVVYQDIPCATASVIPLCLCFLLLNSDYRVLPEGSLTPCAPLLQEPPPHLWTQFRTVLPAPVAAFFLKC